MIGKAKAELKNSTFRKECAGLKTAHFGKNVRDLKQHILRVRRAIQDIENGKELLWLTQHQKKCAGLKTAHFEGAQSNSGH